MASQLVEWLILIGTLMGALLGGLSIYWVRGRSAGAGAWWGRRLFVVALLHLGVTALFAALQHANGLAPVGITSGLLLVGMLWESPAAALPDEMNS